VSDALWPELARHFSPEEILELLALCAWYRLIASICTTAGVPLEPWAERFP
jgi:alkylhydroperoxidase family enzyme